VIKPRSAENNSRPVRRWLGRCLNSQNHPTQNTEEVIKPDNKEKASVERYQMPKAKRWFKITVRGKEALRYTIPDFFPDFNYIPPPAKPLDEGNAGSKPTERERTYYWKRSVIAGVEASTPTRRRRTNSSNYGDSGVENPSALPSKLASTTNVKVEKSATTYILGGFTALLFLVAFLLGLASAGRDMLPANLTAPAVIEPSEKH